MLEVVSKNFFTKEVLEYGARCALAGSIAWVGSEVYKSKETPVVWKKITELVTDQLILEAFLFKGNVNGANSFRLYSFALRGGSILVNDAMQGRLPKKFSPQMESIRQCVSDVFMRLFYPFYVIGRALPHTLTWLTFATGFEVLNGALLQEGLLRQLPKYIFTATQICSAEIVDSLPGKVIRIALGSLLFGGVSNNRSDKLFKNILFWGSGPGFLTETMGFAPGAIQMFAQMLRGE